MFGAQFNYTTFSNTKAKASIPILNTCIYVYVHSYVVWRPIIIVLTLKTLFFSQSKQKSQVPKRVSFPSARCACIVDNTITTTTLQWQSLTHTPTLTQISQCMPCACVYVCIFFDGGWFFFYFLPALKSKSSKPKVTFFGRNRNCRRHKSSSQTEEEEAATAVSGAFSHSLSLLLTLLRWTPWVFELRSKQNLRRVECVAITSEN